MTDWKLPVIKIRITVHEIMKDHQSYKYNIPYSSFFFKYKINAVGCLTTDDIITLLLYTTGHKTTDTLRSLAHSLSQCLTFPGWHLVPSPPRKKTHTKLNKKSKAIEWLCFDK